MRKLDADPMPPGDSGTEVLDNLRLLSGARFSTSSELNQIVGNKLRLVFVFGPPGEGKTTSLLQLASGIRRLSGGDLEPSIYLFEESLEESQAELGPKAEWKKPEWDIASEQFRNRIEERIPTADEGRILLVESVSVGVTNRGITTLRDIAMNHPRDAFYLPIVGDPKVQERAAFVRSALGRATEGQFEIPDNQVVDFLRRNSILPTGLGEVSVEEAGRKIREIFGRMDRQIRVGRIIDPETYAYWEDRYFQTGQLPEGAGRLPEIVEMFIQSTKWAQEVGLTDTAVEPIPPVQDSDAAYGKFIRGQYFYHRVQKAKLGLPNRLVPLLNAFLPYRPIHMDMKMLDQRTPKAN